MPCGHGRFLSYLSRHAKYRERRKDQQLSILLAEVAATTVCSGLKSCFWESPTDILYLSFLTGSLGEAAR